MAAQGAADVFVLVPAYRDAELVPTLRDIYAQAAQPDRIRTCVIWQYAPGETLPDLDDLPRLEIVAVPARESRGCNWARGLGQLLWKGEPFTLLLDSHHRFVEGWDAQLLAMYEQLRDSGVRRPLLTAYLPAYDPALDPAGRGESPHKIYPLQRDDGVLTRLTSYPIPWWESLSAPIEANFLSLHLIFTDGRFHLDVPIPQQVYFFGDEVATSLDAYTAGFDLYHPHRIVGWHAYSRNERVPHWDDHADWADRHRASLSWMRSRFDPRTARPGVRTVADYERRIMTELVTP